LSLKRRAVRGEDAQAVLQLQDPRPIIFFRVGRDRVEFCG
jgi:hypothetical protein